MIDQTSTAGAAQALLQAYRTREPIEPLTSTHPGLTVADAYAIQAEQITAWQHEGRAVRGYKVGLTSTAMQHQLGVDQPDYGFLVDGMYHRSGDSLVASSFIAPRVEPEIAFVLSADLAGPGVTLADARAAVGGVVASLEIIDSRIADWRITLADTIADNASSAGVVVGGTSIPLDDIDIDGLAVALAKNGELVGEGRGAAVLGSPLNALVWLANTLGEHGVTLASGSLVLPGSVCAATAVTGGDEISADFGPLGTVTVRFDGTSGGRS
jgi:2-keto-4-pentenoate hydratase